MPKYTASQTVRLDYVVEAETPEQALEAFYTANYTEIQRDPIGDIEVSLDGKLLLP